MSAQPSLPLKPVPAEIPTPIACLMQQLANEYGVVPEAAYALAVAKIAAENAGFYAAIIKDPDGHIQLHCDAGIKAVMTRERALDRLTALVKTSDPETAHNEAEEILLALINDDEITEAYNRVPRHA